jgi:hypothetical protein
MNQEPRIKQGIQFVQTDQINGELRIIGEDDAASLLYRQHSGSTSTVSTSSQLCGSSIRPAVTTKRTSQQPW